MRIATFNMENLFSRPNAMSDDPDIDSSDVLKDFQKLNMLIQYKTYTVAVKEELLALIDKHGVKAPRPKTIRLHEVREKLVVAPQNGAMRIDIDGRDDWVGWFDLIRRDVSWKATYNTARVIDLIRPDILLAVEVEDRLAMQRFHDQVLASNFPESSYPFNVLIDGNDERGIDIGLYSRYPIVSVRTHIDERDESGSPLFSRDCPEFEIALRGGRTLIVLGNHFKSKGYGQPAATAAKRLRQARRVCDLARDAIERSDLVLVAGDLNDTPDSPPLKALRNGIELKDISAHPKYEGRVPTYGGSQSLNNKIDYLLMSPALYDTVSRGAVEISGVYAPIAGAPFPDLSRKQDQASDHGLLWADVDL